MKPSLHCLLVLVLILAGLSVVAQEKPRTDQLPPIKELPAVGESKTFYELDGEHAYSVFDHEGRQVLKGHGRFVDLTDLGQGLYFIQYDGRKVRYTKE